MKIKTANIRMLLKGEKPYLKSVTVKKTLIYAGELFFVHGVTRSWQVTHYKTGLRACNIINARLADVEEKFTASMAARPSDALQKAVDAALTAYGVANELPEVNK